MKPGIKRFNLDIKTEQEENKDGSKSPKRPGPAPERKTPTTKKSPNVSPVASKSPRFQAGANKSPRSPGGANKSPRSPGGANKSPNNKVSPLGRKSILSRLPVGGLASTTSAMSGYGGRRGTV